MSSPTAYEITRAIILTNDGTPADITTTFIGKFEITQSMNSSSWAGSVFVVDAANILEGLPIRGEEFFELWIKTFDTGLEVKLMTRIHSVTNITPAVGSNYLSYTLNFVSESTFNASTRRLTEGHDSSVNVIVKNIFEKNYAKLGEGDALEPEDPSRILPLNTRAFPILSMEYDRSFYITPTAGLTRVIIPDLSPMDAMYFMASRAYQPDSPSQYFRFFETLENFYFTTDEYFLKGLRNEKDVKVFHYAPDVPLEPENMEAQFTRIESLQVLSKGINTSEDLASGAYRNEVVQIDLIRRKLEITPFNFSTDARYVDMTGNPRDIRNNPHSPRFRDETFTEENARRFMIFRDYQRPGDISSSLRTDQNIADIISNRVSYYHHLNNTAVVATLKGRLDLRPGQCIDIDIKDLKGVELNSSKQNTSLSGRYLIQSTIHSGDEKNTLNTQLRLVKFGWASGSDGSQNNEVSSIINSGTPF